MKSVRYAATAAVLGMACLAQAGADPASTSSTSSASSGDTATPAKSETQITDLGKDLLSPGTQDHSDVQSLIPAPNPPADANFNSNLYLNNGGELPVIKPTTPQPTQDEIETYLQRQSEAAKNKDWLLRGYEEQMQAHLGKAANDQSTNLYYTLTTDKDLAKLAGLSTLEPPTETPVTTPRTEPINSDKGALVLREDPSQENAKPRTPDIAAFKPLINPEDPALANSWNNPYTSLLYTATGLAPQSSRSTQGDSVQNSPTTPDPTVKTSDVSIPTAIETPGLISAQSDPSAQNDPLARSIAEDGDAASGFSPQDPLPQNPLGLTTLPGSLPNTDSAQLQLKYDAALGVPGSLKNTGTQPQQLANPPTYKIPANAEPVVKVAQPNPVRRPIADPLIIPYR